jgi:deoxyinosine 3'endonuclease (endonuclease V)
VQAGFLGFREVDGYIQVVEKMKAAGCMPQCVIVDGNGVLHPRRFGSASHFGVITGDILILWRCVGLGKSAQKNCKAPKIKNLILINIIPGMINI